MDVSKCLSFKLWHYISSDHFDNKDPQFWIVLANENEVIRFIFFRISSLEVPPFLY